MPSNHYSSGNGVQRRDTSQRPIPRYYSQPGMSKAISDCQIARESNAIVIGLSVITCIAAFVLAYGGWSF